MLETTIIKSDTSNSTNTNTEIIGENNTHVKEKVEPTTTNQLDSSATINVKVVGEQKPAVQEEHNQTVKPANVLKENTTNKKEVTVVNTPPKEDIKQVLIKESKDNTDNIIVKPALKNPNTSSNPSPATSQRVKEALVKFNDKSVIEVPKSKPKPAVIKPTPANFAVVKLTPSASKPVTLSNRPNEETK